VKGVRTNKMVNIGTQSPSALRLDTGWPDDRRAVLTPEHPQFEKALYAYERQGGWSDEEHRAFWSGFDWPRSRGKPSTRERSGDLVAVLDSLGFTREEIAAEVLYVTPESLRTHDLYGIGEDTRLEDRRYLDGAEPPRERGPWVHRDDEDREYAVVPALDAPEWQEADEAHSASQGAFGPDGLVKRALRDGRLRKVGALYVCVGDSGELDVQKALEGLDLPDEVIADAQRRGKLPYPDGTVRRGPDDDLEGLEEELGALDEFDV
jgi:hypothetical protein